MKTSRLISGIVIVAMLGFVSCSKDSSNPTVTLVPVSGTVTYTNANGASANAVGAVVKLGTATDTVVAIADASGNYKIPSVAAGSYTLIASYFTDNKNVTGGRLGGLTFTTLAPEAITVAATAVSKNLVLTSAGQSGVVAMDVNYTWSGSAYVNTGTYTFDGAHSPVNFAFSYRAHEAEFNGGFGQFSKAIITFDPANLATSSINVEIDLASVNTRSAGGRDNTLDNMINPTFSPLSNFTKLGCIMGTFGITADGTLPSTITTNTKRYAQFVSSSIAKLGDGYVAKGNLTFNGVTKAIEVWFKGVPEWLDTSNNRTYAGFEGRFYINAKNDFNITSSSVNDANIEISVSMVIYK